MKRALILVLAVLMVLSLFAGCGGNTNTPPAGGGETQAPATQAPATQAPATKAPATQAPASAKPAETEAPQETEAPPPEEPGLPFAVDENGIATEQYNWPLPLTEDDTPFTYWTTCWTPEYLPEDGFGATELPMEAEKRTGVNVEYILAPTTSRNEAFSVMLAADDLCDICCNANSYYTGTVVEMVEDGYFVNVYDYREYMPNFLWHVTYEHPEDTDTRSRVYYYKDFIPVVYSLSIKFGEMIGGYTFREDLLEQVGKKIDDIVYWQGWEDALMAVKVAEKEQQPVPVRTRLLPRWKICPSYITGFCMGFHRQLGLTLWPSCSGRLVAPLYMQATWSLLLSSVKSLGVEQEDQLGVMRPMPYHLFICCIKARSCSVVQPRRTSPSWRYTAGRPLEGM